MPTKVFAYSDCIMYLVHQWYASTKCYRMFLADNFMSCVVKLVIYRLKFIYELA
jgi:hypothetical protein